MQSIQIWPYNFQFSMKSFTDISASAPAPQPTLVLTKLGDLFKSSELTGTVVVRTSKQSEEQARGLEILPLEGRD